MGLKELLLDVVYALGHKVRRIARQAISSGYHHQGFSRVDRLIFDNIHVIYLPGLR